MEILKNVFLIVLFACICLTSPSSSAHCGDLDSLVQVQVLHRHGDRTPDIFSFYPNDPHINDTWYPEGLGALTLKGKRQEYNIGRELRATYGCFFGHVYTPTILDAWSTDYNRTKMSLLLSLAGAWPPTASQVWNTHFPWQPIPYNYYPAHLDKLLSFPAQTCPQYLNEYGNAVKSAEVQAYLKKNAHLIAYINKYSGLDCKIPLDLYNLHFGLFAQQQTGRKLPAWTTRVLAFLKEATIFEYKVQTYNNFLKQESGGRLIRKIYHDMYNKANGKLIPADRKLFIYSAHEYNIAHVLRALNLFNPPHIPKYGSYLVFELHYINKAYAIRILYQNYEAVKPRVLTIPGCTQICPLNKFRHLVAHVLPTGTGCA